MQRISKYRSFSWFFLGVTLIALTHYSCMQQKSAEDSALTINNYTLSAAEFNELFYEQASEDIPLERKEFLDSLVTKKLMLQEAQRQGLDKEKDFLKSIERFWEQALLKIVVNAKVQEIQKDLQVSDEEIEVPFQKWIQENPGNTRPEAEVRDFIKTMTIKQKEAQALQDWIRQLHENAKIDVQAKALGLE